MLIFEDRTSLGFSAAIGFTGEAVDPLLVSRTVLYDLIHHHIIGNTPVQHAMSYAANFHLLRHTSILVCSNHKSFLMSGATVRHQPNGIKIQCPQCGQTPSFFKFKNNDQAAVFRCPGEHTSRKFMVSLVTDNENRTVYGQPRSSARHIIFTHENLPQLLENNYF